MANLYTKDTLSVDGKNYTFYNITKVPGSAKLPFSLKILLENLLRNLEGKYVTENDIEELIKWLDNRRSKHEISYMPARVLMQDFTGVPAVVDLASMRDAMKKLGGKVSNINPNIPVDLIIDHSVQVDKYGSPGAFTLNVELEMSRNAERYQFLKWGQQSFDNFRVVPPGTGICHQVNLEYLAQVVWTKDSGNEKIAYPDTVVGTDSHTTMINGLGVLGWGVGGIEAEASMLGQPISMLIPEVIGFKLEGALKEGTTATDLVLTVTEILRKKGVVGKFVEFYGPGLNSLSLADRATIANMAPEYGATCGLFPIDQQTLNYLTLTNRSPEQIKLVESYAKAQGMWSEGDSDYVFTDVVKLDVSSVEPCLAGPKRPQDRVLLSDMPKSYINSVTDGDKHKKGFEVNNKDYEINNGDVVIAAITSCTNTSNPSVMIAAGLVAKKANERGINTKPWVKTSLAPGSKVVTEYLEQSGLQKHLDALGFHTVGYGCTTCIGNSGPLDPGIHDAISDNNLDVSAVLSGNRNFEGRVHPLTKLNYLASPPLVVAYAILGTVVDNIHDTPLGIDTNGAPVYLQDVWPTNAEIENILKSTVNADMFRRKYADIFTGDQSWIDIKTPDSTTYDWDSESTYIQHPPYFEDMSGTGSDQDSVDIKNCRILALLGDSVTTDHISPAGVISKGTPAANYLEEKGISPREFNSYGSRRGNHNVMVRGTFANIRIKNQIVPETEGGFTKKFPEGNTTSIYDAAMQYKSKDIPLLIIAGKEYGTGSSRDWAAKGTLLLGIKAVIAESFERIHRSNLIGMNVLPLVFLENVSWQSLGLSGSEVVDIRLPRKLTPMCSVDMSIQYDSQKTENVKLVCRLDTQNEIEYYMSGGILKKVLFDMNSNNT